MYDNTKRVIYPMKYNCIDSDTEIRYTNDGGVRMSDFQKFLDENLENIHLESDDVLTDSAPVYDIYTEVRQAIVSLRKTQHMTQKELAARTGLTQANICNLEKPTIDSLKKIADATGTRLTIEFVEQEVL